MSDADMPAAPPLGAPGEAGMAAAMAAMQQANLGSAAADPQGAAAPQAQEGPQQGHPAAATGPQGAAPTAPAPQGAAAAPPEAAAAAAAAGRQAEAPAGPQLTPHLVATITRAFRRIAQRGGAGLEDRTTLSRLITPLAGVAPNPVTDRTCLANILVKA